MEKFQNINLPVLDCMTDLAMLLSAKTVGWKDNQIGLTTTDDGPDSPYYGIGSLVTNWDDIAPTTNKDGNTIIAATTKEAIKSEFDYTRLCSVFNGTVFEEIHKLLNEHYRVGRIRLIRLEPKTCLSWHSDPSPRVHYPIKTNEGCFMVIEGQSLHLPLNTWWQVDTSRFHSVFNGGLESRIHLVAVVDEKDK